MTEEVLREIAIHLVVSFALILGVTVGVVGSPPSARPGASQLPPITAEPTPTRRILRAEYVLITRVVTPTPTTEVGR